MKAVIYISYALYLCLPVEILDQNYVLNNFTQSQGSLMNKIKLFHIELWYLDTSSHSPAMYVLGVPRIKGA